MSAVPASVRGEDVSGEERLLDDPASATMMGKAAHQRAHELYLGDVHLERWAELVLRTAGGPDAGR